MMDGLREMWEALRAALARQALETPDFLAPWLTKAARLALIAAALFAALAAGMGGGRLGAVCRAPPGVCGHSASRGPAGAERGDPRVLRVLRSRVGP